MVFNFSFSIILGGTQGFGSASSAMSFDWRRMSQGDEYLMRRSVEVCEEDDLIGVRSIKLM